MTQHSCSSTSIFVWPVLILCCTAVSADQGASSRTADKTEEWGYFEVRQGAHMFWWLYRSPTQTKIEWPLVLWLQGGPGGSGVGIGNFEEIGPLTTALLPRQYTWLQKADLLFVLSWGPVLKTFSRIDDYQENIINREAQVIQSDVNQGAYLSAFNGWSSLESTILNLTNNVDFYNLLFDQEQDSSLGLSEVLGKESMFLKFGSYLKQKMLKESNQTVPDLASLMNGPIRKKLQIIPETVIWKEISGSVFSALEDEFMRDVIPKVDELLSNGISVTIYSGQLDLICATQGTEAWVQKLKWTGMEGFRDAPRTPLYCKGSVGTAAFVKSYRNLAFYWILQAGHMVPADNPCIALDMLELITKPK